MAKEKLVFNHGQFFKPDIRTGRFNPSAEKFEFIIGSEPVRPVRIGFVGVGSRGMSMLKVTLSLEGVEIPVVCDIVEEKVERAQNFVEEAGQPRPKGFTGPEDYKRVAET